MQTQSGRNRQQNRTIQHPRERFQIYPDGNPVYTPKEGSFIPQNHPLYQIYGSIHLQTALDFLKMTNEKTFIRFVVRLWDYCDSDQKLNLVYYIILFRREPHIRSLLSHGKLPHDLVDAIIREAVSRQSAEEKNSTLDEVLDLIPGEALFNLAVRNAGEKESVGLHILLKMDIKQLDRYFEDPLRVRLFIKAICSMPKESVKRFFFRNPKLHGYYVFLFNAAEISSIEKAEEIYALDFSEIEAAHKLSKDIKTSFNLETEMSIPLPQRNTARLAYIISSIRSFREIPQLLGNLVEERVIDSIEKSLIQEIIENPLFRDVLDKYAAAPALRNDPVLDFML